MCYVHNQWYDISCATLYVVKFIRNHASKLTISVCLRSSCNEHVYLDELYLLKSNVQSVVSSYHLAAFPSI